MKGIKTLSTIFCIMVMIATTVKAQIGESRNVLSFGVNGGVNMNTIGFDPTIKQMQHLGPTLGVTFRYTCEKYFATICALQMELNYSQLGWKEDIMNSQNEKIPDTYQRNMNYIQFPMLARLGWGREQRGFQFYFLAGPQLGFCFSETSERSDIWTLNINGQPDRPNQVNQQYEMPIKNKFDYGITGGIGLELSTKIGHFMIEGRYYYGLSDIYGNGKTDPFARSNNGTITAKITYLIDIKSDLDKNKK